MEVHAPVFMPRLRPLIARLSNLNLKGGHAKGDPPPPKKPVWCRREQSGSTTTSFWRGRASVGIAHRQGKHNM
eukprot:9018534-Ditylum_brightwellii.AAC.1